jgi:hypothetical protein
VGTAQTSSEDELNPEEGFTCDEEFGDQQWPAAEMFMAVARTRAEEMQGVLECEKGEAGESSSAFKGQRREEGAMIGVLAINGRRGVGGLLPLRGGGRLMAEE